MAAVVSKNQNHTPWILLQTFCSKVYVVLIVTVEGFSLNDAKLVISLLKLKWKLDFLKQIKKIFSILYRHVEKPKFISHQRKKICSNLISIYAPLRPFFTVNKIRQISYISTYEHPGHSFICLFLQAICMPLCSSVLLGN